MEWWKLGSNTIEVSYHEASKRWVLEADIAGIGDEKEEDEGNAESLT